MLLRRRLSDDGYPLLQNNCTAFVEPNKWKLSLPRNVPREARHEHAGAGHAPDVTPGNHTSAPVSQRNTPPSTGNSVAPLPNK
jgi:hypothetical protein